MTKPNDDRFQGYCEWCGTAMYMQPHGWPRRRPRRWCSRECRTAGNHAEERGRKA